MQSAGDSSLPPRFADLKREIATSLPNFKDNVTRAWGEVIEALKKVNEDIASAKQDYIPQVKFSDLQNLDKAEIEKIKMRGSVVIRDVVPDAEALRWKEQLEEFIKDNPNVEGIPENNKQFFQLFWTKSQVEARSHPNMLAASVWLNNLYHTKQNAAMEGVDLSTPLSYADRFRIRRPGVFWTAHPPHIDGGTIERWEDPTFRKCFSSILNGNWREHDPYELDDRLTAISDRYGRPNQSSVFRTFQGWLAMSETGPHEGTLRVYPNVQLSNAYIILRPFFRPTVPAGSDGFLDAKNWEFDTSSPNFPGIHARDGGYAGPHPTPELHPHLELEKTVTSVPKVFPGDTVFWHCDVIHSVEEEHTGSGDSAVMYIPSVPLTPMNQSYVERQRDAFLGGQRPPDFPQGPGEDKFLGTGLADDILVPVGRRAMDTNLSVTLRSLANSLEPNIIAQVLPLILPTAMRQSVIRFAESISRKPLKLNEGSANMTPAIPLYRQILRAHRSLPREMRSMGDDYVKAEFRRHREVTTPTFIIGFLSQWNVYLNELRKQLRENGFSGKKLEPEVFEKMSAEQLGQLYELKKAVKDVWKPVPDQQDR